jgi:hypothetical protein
MMLEARTQPRAPNDVAFHALEERDEVAPAALGVLRGPEALVLQHPSAKRELSRSAVADIGKDDHGIAQL